MLLGASNLTLGYGIVGRLIRAGLTGPLDLRIAFGHGRSFGKWSMLLGRGLPPIVDCGLWAGLAAEPAANTYAVLTDVGNDLMYGFEPAQIATWVESCLARLSGPHSRIIVTGLPVARVERLGAARYHATRFGFFPTHRPLSWTSMLARVRELDALVLEIARRYGAATIVPPLDWYGFDPIHIVRRQQVAAWSRILSAWPGFHPCYAPSTSVPRVLGRGPQLFKLFGRSCTASQPCAAASGMSLSLY